MSIKRNYCYLLQLFEESAGEENVTDMKNRLYGLCYQMKMFEHFFGLCLAIETLAITDQLATQLQSVKLCAYDGKELAKNAIATLKVLKLEFEKFWANVTASADELGVGKPKLKRKAQPPLRFQNENLIVAPGPSTAKDYYEEIYLDAFEYIIKCLEERFDQKGLQMYENLQQVLILAAKKEDYEEKLKEVLQFYNNEKSYDFNEDSLRTQLKMFSANYPQKDDTNMEDIIEHLMSMPSSSRKMISEVVKILELILVLPATNATSERTFSKLRLIKTYLRSTMTQGRLNHLMICAIYHEDLDNLDLEEMAFKFVERYPSRQHIFQVPAQVQEKFKK